MKLKAGSLYYAIIVCILIGVISISFVTISYFSKLQSVSIEKELDLISENNSVVNYCLNNLDGFTEFSQNVNPLDTDIEHRVSVKKWGFYKLLNVESTWRNSSIQKNCLLGERLSNTALYLLEKDIPLKVEGNVKIVGDAFLPKKGIENAYLDTKVYNNRKVLYGKRFTAFKDLPSVDGVFGISGLDNDYQVIDNYQIVNSFEKKTMRFLLKQPILNGVNFSGNIVLFSKDSIFISKNNVLNDVIISAPIVVFENDFSGVVQVSATEKVIVGKNVQLRYPSGIYLNSNLATSNSNKEVVFQSNSKCAGIVVVDGNSNQNYDNWLRLEEGALIYGNAYCRGNTELKSNIYGSLFTEKFYLETEMSVYENYIKNVEINNTKLPKIFLGLSFKPTYEKKYKIIKSF